MGVYIQTLSFVVDFMSHHSGKLIACVNQSHIGMHYIVNSLSMNSMATFIKCTDDIVNYTAGITPGFHSN